MLSLPDVTLTLYEGRAFELAAAALKDMTAKVKFAEVIVYSDKDIAFDYDKRIPTPPAPKEQMTAMITRYSGLEVSTSHFIQAQWDSGIVDPFMWSDEFLDYDFIGAVWPWIADYRVGNGGFALYSRRLMKFLKAHHDEFPSYGDDALLSRTYRPRLEQEGFKWAPEEIAERFAFERGPARRTFGYHGVYNMPRVLPVIDFLERLDMDGGYIRTKSEWHETAVIAGIPH